ncbi:MAG TPA: hypothetical protein VHD83_13595 [Puia sp.]|nr:hypothetical protein [Puia sp.]
MKVMLKIVPITLFISLAFTGCAVLTDSQVKNINAFAATAKSYSAYPSAVLRQRADFHLHSELVVASQFTDADAIDHRLDGARKNYNSAIQLSSKFDLSLQLIQQYAGLLTKLSSDQYITDLNAPATSLGENLSSLVTIYNSKVRDTLPSTLSSSISKVVLLIGKTLTRHKQTAALKEFVLAGDTLIQVTIRNLTTVLDGETFTDARGNTFPSLKSLLATDKDFFIQSYRNVVFGNSGKIDYESTKFYYEELTAYDNTEQLRQAVVQAAKSLAKAHSELAKNVREKKDLKDIIAQTQQLITDVQSAGNIFSEIPVHIKLP